MKYFKRMEVSRTQMSRLRISTRRSCWDYVQSPEDARLAATGHARKSVQDSSIERELWLIRNKRGVRSQGEKWAQM